ncbi:hypothetical protein GF362_01350 [Candidatus Dojkabacteria bacterium]|nr:hypothetical protein [Candidatus Dojkabacteria bacterium]
MPESAQKNTKKILPILIGIFFLLAVVVLGVFLMQSPKATVESLMVTNIADTSATVVWTTQEPTKGVVYVSDTNEWGSLATKSKDKYWDTRDIEVTDEGETVLKEEGVGKYYTHHVTVTGLEPEKEYFIRTGDGGMNTYELAEGETWPTVKTGPTLEMPVVPNTVYGKVVDEGGNPVTDAVVTIQLQNDVGMPNSTAGSTVLAENGTYTLEISNLRNIELNKVFLEGDITHEKIEVISPKYAPKSHVVPPNLDQPVNDIEVKVETVNTGANALQSGFVLPVRADECSSQSDFIESCKRGEPSPGAWNCEGQDWDAWKKDNCPEEEPEETPAAGDDGGTDTGGAGGDDDSGTGGGGSAPPGGCISGSGTPYNNGDWGCSDHDACWRCCNGNWESDPAIKQNCSGGGGDGDEDGGVVGDRVLEDCTTPAGNPGKRDPATGVCMDEGIGYQQNATYCEGNKLYKVINGVVQYQKTCKECIDHGSDKAVECVPLDTGEGTVTSSCNGNDLHQTVTTASETDTVVTHCAQMDPPRTCEETSSGVHECVEGDVLPEGACTEISPCGYTISGFTEGQSTSFLCTMAGDPNEGHLLTYECQTAGSDPVQIGNDPEANVSEVQEDASGQYVEVQRGSEVVKVYVGAVSSGNGCPASGTYNCSVYKPPSKDSIVTAGDTFSFGARTTNGRSQATCSGVLDGESFSWTVKAMCLDGIWENPVAEDVTSGIDTSVSCPSISVESVETVSYTIACSFKPPRDMSDGSQIAVVSGRNLSCDPSDPSDEALNTTMWTCSGGASGCLMTDTVNVVFDGEKVEVPATCTYSLTTAGSNGTITCNPDTVDLHGSSYRCVGLDTNCTPSGGNDCFIREEGASGMDKEIRLNNSLFNKVYAQDPAASGFQGPGVYKINLQGFEITTETVKIVEVDENGDPKIQFFEDTNKNGIKDEGEKDIDVSFDLLSITQTESGEDFRLNIGWNLIGLPLLPTNEQENKASGLLKSINDQGIYATQIAKYYKGQWIMYTYRNDTGETFGSDFQLVPGEGYFIRSYQRGGFVLTGNKYDESVPVEFMGGWNLISVISPQKSYTAESVLDAVSSTEILTADTVSEYSDGSYSSVVKNGGVLYGNDFKILEKRGYFVKVEEGQTGKWVP